MFPDLRNEKRLWRRGYKRIAGLDEAGRGPLAGPVVAGAVVVKLKNKNKKSKILFREVRDSKKLSPKKRERIYNDLIKNPQIEWGIGRVSEKVIDKINILEATKLAMKRAIKSLEKKLQRKDKYHIFRDRKKSGIIDFLILDGSFGLDIKIPQKSIKRADEKVFSCSAASILAKVTRDRIMERYAKRFPKYGFEKHKGYPTKLHLRALRKYGPCKIHRKSFGPVKK